MSTYGSCSVLPSQESTSASNADIFPLTSNDDDENVVVEEVVYWRRWYILGIFSLYSMWSCSIWNTFGPIADSAMKVYSWNTQTIALLSMWGTVDFILFTVPGAWLLSKSLRFCIVLGAILMVVGSGLRCVPLIWPSVSNNVFEILCHICSAINCMGGPVAMAAPLQISAAWFPVNERTTATSIAQMANSLGVGVSFVLGNQMVNSVVIENSNSSHNLSTTPAAVTQEIDLDNVKEDINKLMYLYGGVSVAIAVCIIAYFPSEPPNPPSTSAAVTRMDFLVGAKALVKSKNAWLLMLTYAVSQSLLQMWQSMMVVNMTNLGMEEIDEEWASTLGIYISFVAVGVSVLTATFMDCFKGHMKTTIIILFISSGIIFIFCTLIMEKVIKMDPGNFKLTMYILLLIGASLTCSCAPIAFELTAEVLYPASEGLLGCWLGGWFNIIAFFFFLNFFINPDNNSWLNYVPPVSVILPIPFLLMVRVNYNRLEIDLPKL